MELMNLGGGAGYVKAGFLGFSGSGKTYTAVELALGIRRQLGLKGGIGLHDTEAAAQYVAPRVKKETGLDLLGIQSRALSDSVGFLNECMKRNISVAIVDSVTHLWRELCDSYLKQVNEKGAKNGKGPRVRLEFQDWGPIKAKWAVFSDLYLNCPMHVIIAGRAGYEYDYETREDGTGKDLVKTGIRMKTEGEFGFEPSLLVQMERIQTDSDGNIMPKINHRATIIKDRFGILDGKSCDNPTFEFFKPFVDLLTPGQVVQVDTVRQTDLGISESGDAEWHQERTARTILCEEIAAILLAHFPGRSAPETVAKNEIVNRAFGTTSWTAVEKMDSKQLRRGKDDLPKMIEAYKAEVAAIDKAASDKVIASEKIEAEKKAAKKAEKGVKV